MALPESRLFRKWSRTPSSLSKSRRLSMPANLSQEGALWWRPWRALLLKWLSTWWRKKITIRSEWAGWSTKLSIRSWRQNRIAQWKSSRFPWLSISLKSRDLFCSITTVRFPVWNRSVYQRMKTWKWLSSTTRFQMDFHPLYVIIYLISLIRTNPDSCEQAQVPRVFYKN